jgi:hypothetical protein
MRCSHKSDVKSLGRTSLPVWPFVDWLDLRLPAIYGPFMPAFERAFKHRSRPHNGSWRAGARQFRNLGRSTSRARDPGWKYTPATVVVLKEEDCPRTSLILPAPRAQWPRGAAGDSGQKQKRPENCAKRPTGACDPMRIRHAQVECAITEGSGSVMRVD